MIAWTLTNNGTEIIVGAIATLGLIGAAWVPVRRTRRAAEATRETLGEAPRSPDDPDQSLTVVQMLQRLLDAQSLQDNRLAAHDALHAAHTRQLGQHEDLHRRHTERLDAHEEAIRLLQGGDQ